MRTTPLDIRQKEFKTTFRGYSVKEVQDFLLEFASEYENFISEFNLLKEEKDKFQAEINNYRAYDQKLRDALLAAQQVSEERKANAEKEAELIIREARLQAEEIQRQTRLTLEKLQREIEGLKAQKKAFITRLRLLVQSHLKLLEGDELEQPELEDGTEG